MYVFVFLGRRRQVSASIHIRIPPSAGFVTLQIPDGF